MSRVAAIVLVIGLVVTLLGVTLCVISYAYDQVVKPHDLNLPGLLATLALIFLIPPGILLTLAGVGLWLISAIAGSLGGPE